MSNERRTVVLRCTKKATELDDSRVFFSAHFLDQTLFKSTRFVIFFSLRAFDSKHDQNTLRDCKTIMIIEVCKKKKLYVFRTKNNISTCWPERFLVLEVREKYYE